MDGKDTNVHKGVADVDVNKEFEFAMMMNLCVAHVALHDKLGNLDTDVDISQDSQTLFIQCPECKKWCGWQKGVPEGFFMCDYHGFICHIVHTCCGVYCVNIPAEEAEEVVDLTKYQRSPHDKAVQDTIMKLYAKTAPKWITDYGYKANHVETFDLPLMKVTGIRLQGDDDEASNPFFEVDTFNLNDDACDWEYGDRIGVRLADGRVTSIFGVI